MTEKRFRRIPNGTTLYIGGSMTHVIVRGIPPVSKPHNRLITEINGQTCVIPEGSDGDPSKLDATIPIYWLHTSYKQAVDNIESRYQDLDSDNMGNMDHILERLAKFEYCKSSRERIIAASIREQVQRRRLREKQIRDARYAKIEEELRIRRREKKIKRDLARAAKSELSQQTHTPQNQRVGLRQS